MLYATERYECVKYVIRRYQLPSCHIEADSCRDK